MNNAAQFMSDIDVQAGMSERRLRELVVSWRQGLQGVSLIAELPFRDDEAYAALSRVLMHYKLNRGAERAKILRQYRAALLVGLTSVAANEYADGTFWPAVVRSSKQHLNAAHQSELGSAFQSGLDRYHLSRFETPHRYVGEILMHAGVPVSGLATYLELLAKKDKGDRLSGAIFNAWIARSDQHTLTVQHHLSVPVTRFLAHGREVAEDFTDRALDMMAALSQGVEADLTSIGLPQRITDAARELLAGGSMRPAPSNRGHRRVAAMQLVPEIRYDPIRLGVYVSLPPLSTDGIDIQWTVATRENVLRKTVDAAWPGEPSVGAQLSVVSPNPLVEVSVTPGTNSWSLDLVRQEDPLLVFDSAGRLLAPRSLLPQTELTLLYPRMVAGPSGLVKTVLESDLGIVDSADFDPPFGWEDWTVTRLSGAHLKSLRLTTTASWRTVSTVEYPRLGPEHFLDHAFSHEGKRIWAQAPALILPASAGDAVDISWLVEISSVATGEVVSAFQQLVGRDEVIVDPWPAERDPLVGSYAIRVRGPLGRGLEKEIVLAEGFEVEASSRFRMMRTDGGGLEDCALTLTSSEEGWDASPPCVTLGARQTHALVALRDARGGTLLTVRLEVEHMSVSRVFDGGIPVVSSQLQNVDIEFLHLTKLSIVTPNDAYIDLLLRTSTGVIQTLVVKGMRGRRSFNLAEIADSVRDAGDGELMLAINGVGIPIATCKPRRLAEGLVQERPESISVVGMKTRGDVIAAVYAAYAPWIPAYTARVDSDGAILIPESMRGLRSYRVTLRMDVPHFAEPWPAFPDLLDTNTFRVESQALEPHSEVQHGALAQWLAHSSSDLRSNVDVEVAAMLFVHVKELSIVRKHKVVRDTMAEQLRCSGDWLTTVLQNTDYSYLELTPLLVASGLSFSHWDSHASTRDASVWERIPLAAVLAEMPAPGNQSTFDFRASSAEHFGDSALRLLDGDIDPFQTVGGFDQNVSFLAKLPPERLQEMRRASRILPMLYLDKDSRATRGWDIFFSRTDRELGDVNSVSQYLHVALTRAIREGAGEKAVAVMDSRFCGNFGWQALPAISTGMALVSRLAARGHGRAMDVARYYQPLYTKFALREPGLIQQDLVLAELYLRGQENAHVDR